jgi:hypothetical protein
VAWSTPPVTSSRQQQAWPGRQRTRELEALALARGQPAGFGLGALGEADRVEGLERVLPRRRHVGRFLERAHHHVLDDRHPGEWLELLKRASHAEAADLIGPHPGDVVTVEHDTAGRRPLEAGDHVEERRLARPVGTDHAH